VSDVVRPLIAVVFLGVGLIALVIDSADHGWTALRVVGMVCFAAVIVYELVVLVRVRAPR
jgi:membrane-bound ClpP family serine protease